MWHNKIKFLLAALLLSMFGSIFAQSHLPPCPSYTNAYRHNCTGTDTHASGNKYVGEFKDNKFNGQGAANFTDGAKYVGEFKDNKINGQGTFSWADGANYAGEFKDNKRNGQGTYTLANGTKHVGEFKDGMRNGHGTVYLANGLILHQGIWESDKFISSDIKPLSPQMPSVIDFSDAKKKCSELGFKSGTEGFGKCVLQLSK